MKNNNQVNLELLAKKINEKYEGRFYVYSVEPFLLVVKELQGYGTYPLSLDAEFVANGDVDDFSARWCNWAFKRLEELGYDWTLEVVPGVNCIIGYQVTLTPEYTTATPETKAEACALALLAALSEEA